ncbi:Gfo/Idh/MocA family protein [Prevotella sp. 10(H)]|uniref:Gfo/Idh/MocA family protein n=1 Tax=Prevotella sp. 10(H) TaxID=1158294 RepID=UPI0004A77C9A|nr:Gfo/Idh/MocA family oxidoreductase [Prevotella sp. 10(H)]
MKKDEKKDVNRREFLRLSALGLASLTIIPSWSMNGVRIAPSDRVVLGFIGLGQQGLSDFSSFSSCPGVQVVAGSDVDSLKTERFRRRIEAWQKEKGMPVRCDKYEFYEDLLNRKDIDAVSIATPDHWHALTAIMACRAGKDVYCQKPLAYTITEGLAMVEAVKDNKRVLQVGSQQRSSKEFIKAIELVQAGKIGHIEKIYAKVGEPPRPFDLPEQPVPDNLNFNQWLGPLNDPKVHYNSALCPAISLEPEKNENFWAEWRWFHETGNGYTADWGAHMFDISQAAIGMDGSGPVEYIPKGYKGAEYLTMKYANGIIMTEQPYRDDNGGQGIKFIGDKGWIQVSRGFIACSDPSLLKEDEKTTKGVKAGEFEVSSPHMQNFIDCVRSRKKPVASVEVGCSTNTLCCLANIATELKRPVKWNPATLTFVDDKEAENHRLYRYDYRSPYKICGL